MNGKRVASLLAATSPLLAIATCLAPLPASAQERVRFTFHVPAGSLAAALRAVSTASGRSIAGPADLLAGKAASALDGSFTVEAAVDKLLAGSGLRARAIGDGLVIEVDPRGQDVASSAQAADIIVTGSRIRGAPVASPVIVVGSKAIRDAGQTNLGAVVRSIPQSFSGGQNPGVGANVPSASGVNVGGGSTINLRGLGSDATLTLLNGHRLAYNGSRQGIDVTSIPLALVDRLEIVPDGASALYGSDAVAGVANIVLKRDYDRFQVSADLGWATDGGDFEQRYGALGGSRWSSGGIVAAYEYGRNSEIVSTQRSYAAVRPGVWLFPRLRHHSLALAGHQKIADNLEFAVDAIFNRRWSELNYPRNAAGDLSISRTAQFSDSQSIALAPSLTWRPGSWRLALSGVYGDEKVNLESDTYTGSAFTAARVCYCNKGASAELAADGPLFALPGGEAKLAAGIGYRYNLFDAFRAVGDVNNVRRSQDSYYAYGEFNLPFVGPAQAIPGLARLDASAAVRYERYPGIDAVAVPKFGLIYAPVHGLDVKVSWGKSFRAPTLLQQYQVQSALLYPVTSVGGAGYPATATALYVTGGNPALTPERASTWTAGIDVHPVALDGFRFQAVYFSTRYTARIVTPITFLATALSDPNNAARVTLSPGSAAVNARIAAAAQFFNVSGQVFNPAAVVAIIDNTNVNAGRQRISGIDLLADYRRDLGHHAGQILLSANISYLKSNQQLVAGAPIIDKAGTLFNPPHWRGRATVAWNREAVTVAAAFNYTGGVRDIRSNPAVNIRGVSTVDLTIRFAPTRIAQALRGVEFSARLLNAFNAKPQQIATTAFSDSAYDSTNYSPAGRVIGLGIVKTW